VGKGLLTAMLPGFFELARIRMTARSFRNSHPMRWIVREIFFGVLLSVKNFRLALSVKADCARHVQHQGEVSGSVLVVSG